MIRGDPVKNSNNECHFSFSADLKSMAGCCTQDTPYILISRERYPGSGEFVRAWQSENANTHTPAFKSRIISTQQLCNSEETAKIKFAVHNYKVDGNHPVYGFTITSLQDLK